MTNLTFLTLLTFAFPKLSDLAIFDLPDLSDLPDLHSLSDHPSHSELGGVPSWHSDVEGAARDVLIAPLDNEDISALLFHCVADGVHTTAQVFDMHLLTGRLGAVQAHH